MTSFPDPLKSTAIVAYDPTLPHVSLKSHIEKVTDEIFRQSFNAQIADHQHFSGSWYGVETQIMVEALRNKMGPTIPLGAGASVLVAANGEKPRHLGLGRTSVVGGHPININTAAVIGSGAKMFTGILSKVLEQKGILSLQTKFSEVMEERHFAIFQDPVAAEDITLEMLLSHTSGLQFQADTSNNAREGMTWEKILDGMCEDVQQDPQRKIQFTGVPGDGVYAYSNQICLVGMFIETAYNQAHPNAKDKFTYADILTREVLAPLGMSRTSFVKPDENVLRAYRNVNNIPKSKDADIRDPAMQPAGALWSTAADMGMLAEAFAKALKTHEGLKSSDGRTLLLTAEALEDLLRPRDISGVVSLGIDVVGQFFGKGGEISSYDFKFNFDRETGSYIVSLCNFKNSREFGGYVEDGLRVEGYINYVIPAMDEMRSKFTAHKSSMSLVLEQEEINASSTGLPLHSCPVFYYGGMGIIGMNPAEPKWVNWNGEILPLKNAGKNKFLITGDNHHSGKNVRFRVGGKGNSYIFIEEAPKTEKVIIPIAFKMVISTEMARLEEIETMKLQKDLPLSSIVGAQGTYVSTHIGGGPPPFTVSIDPVSGTINVSSQERLDSDGNPLVIPMTISKHQTDQDGQLSELWLVGNFIKVPLFQLKLSKQSSGAWQLEFVDFASKNSVDTLLPIEK